MDGLRAVRRPVYAHLRRGKALPPPAHGLIAAMLVFTLLAMLCPNVFLTSYRRDLKPATHQAISRPHVARQVTAELYANRAGTAPREPPPPNARSSTTTSA